MKIDPNDIVREEKSQFSHLTRTQHICRWAAIAVAFIGVFVWFIKVLFGVP